ncbi:MAG: hypothetical protein IJV54_12840 [Bacteroidales bacterium]|nr:hypothetical protein [Bacteroidales bacterium]MBR1433502.1 hypothetical protein [Bacteroidales bacterium]
MKKKDTLYKDLKHIARQTINLSDERLDFMDGKRLGEVDLLIEDNASVRKVRRIMEKRISQDYWRTRSTANGNGDRHCVKHHLSNQMKNNWGRVPSGFHYCA